MVGLCWFVLIFVKKKILPLNRSGLMDGLDEPRTRAVLRRVVDASQSRHDEDDEKDQEVADDDTIVGLDDVGYEPSSNSNFELQQLGLPPARAKSFAKRFDAALEIDRTEEIIYIDPTKRPRTLRRQELQEWFTQLSPVALVQVGVRGQSSSAQGEQQVEPEQQSGLPSTYVRSVPLVFPASDNFALHSEIGIRIGWT